MELFDAYVALGVGQPTFFEDFASDAEEALRAAQSDARDAVEARVPRFLRHRILPYGYMPIVMLILLVNFTSQS